MHLTQNRNKIKIVSLLLYLQLVLFYSKDRHCGALRKVGGLNKVSLLVVISRYFAFLQNVV